MRLHLTADPGLGGPTPTSDRSGRVRLRPTGLTLRSSGGEQRDHKPLFSHGFSKPSRGRPSMPTTCNDPAATRTAAIRLEGSARPFQAMSKAVPWPRWSARSAIPASH